MIITIVDTCNKIQVLLIEKLNWFLWNNLNKYKNQRKKRQVRKTTQQRQMRVMITIKKFCSSIVNLLELLLTYKKEKK